MTFLVIDIGNSRLKWGLYDSADPDAPLQAHGAVILEEIDQLWFSVWRHLPRPDGMLGCVVAGDAIKRRVEEQLAPWGLKPQWLVSSAVGGGVRNGYDHPHRLGADRWAALVGARHHAVRDGRPVPALVIMVGTAVTIDALDASGTFLGGAIMPGFGLMLRALETGTAGLKVPMGEATDFPTNTSDALTSGGTDAISGAIERIYRRLARREGVDPLLLMSGGAAPKLAQLADELPLRQIDHLIFEGLLTLAAEQRQAARPVGATAVVAGSAG
ncbi:MAG TPA: type III pantothenate kinase [Aquabacterium sp.]|uniref:type III pantothenate kinase n=1 Tax=Aquabacterium sp. TaxID=1872578 RepID=UPI002E368C26|nr:type III pantothenate kinase [Aquabacterium sp.]HEX5371415.1 type III pantothenate kinase [Aquabacterium sp.]